MTAVSTARAWVDVRAASIGALDRGGEARVAGRSLVKACSVRTAPISSAA